MVIAVIAVFRFVCEKGIEAVDKGESPLEASIQNCSCRSNLYHVNRIPFYLFEQIPIATTHLPNIGLMLVGDVM